MAVSDSSISVDVWSEVKTLIVAKAPFVTNSSTSATTAASINASFNDRPSAKPQVVIYPVTYDENEWKFSSIEGHKMISVIIECYAKNTLSIDQLHDQVANALKTTAIGGIELVGITSDYAFNMNNESKWQMKSSVFTYDRE